MQMTRRACALPKRSAFTLIEMMVVVAIIGILIAAVFKLLSAAGEKNKQAVTVMRIERLQNALSSYYAEYGSYPPVMQYEYPDPEKQRTDGDLNNVQDCAFTADSANRAAGSQSVAFEFPSVKSLDDFIDQLYRDENARSAGMVLGNQNLRNNESWSSWYTLPIFRFGLLSYLLPRVHIAGGTEESDRYYRLYQSLQWTRKDPGDSSTAVNKMIETQLAMEERTVARWLPNFEHCICGGTTVMGVELTEPDTGIMFSGLYKAPSGQKFVVQKMTIRDAWGRELYYYSAPPYQSYRVWSAGKDGKTFPPWIPLDAKSNYKQAAAWVEDDIVRFDH